MTQLHEHDACPSQRDRDYYHIHGTLTVERLEALIERDAHNQDMMEAYEESARYLLTDVRTIRGELAEVPKNLSNWVNNRLDAVADKVEVFFDALAAGKTLTPAQYNKIRALWLKHAVITPTTDTAAEVGDLVAKALEATHRLVNALHENFEDITWEEEK